MLDLALSVRSAPVIGGRSLTLAQQIAAMSPSLWLEPSVTGGYQDSAGTLLVTQPGGGAADPPVGKVLDLSGLGNHATQSTSTARPKLSARVNLLTKTEVFSDASAWTFTGTTRVDNAATAPDGTMTASTVAVGSVGQFFAFAPSGTPAGYQSIYMRAAVPVDIDFGTYDGTSVAVRTSITTSWQRIAGPTPAFSGGERRAIRVYTAYGAANLEIWHPQLELGSTASRYQRVTDANTYDYSGFPLIHQFDAVDDAHVITFASSLGSDCTVVTANRGTTPTIQTAQTICTSHTISATHAGKLIFPRALTAAETATVTAWATRQGALS